MALPRPCHKWVAIHRSAISFLFFNDYGQAIVAIVAIVTTASIVATAAIVSTFWLMAAAVRSVWIRFLITTAVQWPLAIVNSSKNGQ